MEEGQMTCSWCGEKISRLRGLIDSRYCSAGHDEQAREHLRQLTVERVRDMVRATPPNPEGKVAPAESSAEPSDLCLGCDETQPIQLSEDLRDIRTTGVNFILHSGGNSS